MSIEGIGARRRRLSPTQVLRRARGHCARYVRDERGVTAIEYALIAAAMAVTIIAGVLNFGQTVNTAFEDTSTAIEGAGE